MSLSQQAKLENSYPQSPFTSPEHLMKKSTKTVANMFNGSGGMSGDAPTFRITMKEYEDMAIEVGDRVGMEIIKVDSAGI
jgi:hypothetical protein